MWCRTIGPGKPVVGLRPLTPWRRENLLSRDSEDMMKFGHTKLGEQIFLWRKDTTMGKLRVYSEVVSNFDWLERRALEKETKLWR